MGTFPVGIIGILVILGLAFLLSNNKRAIRLRVVGAAFALQVTIAFIVLRSDVGRHVIEGMSRGVWALLGYAKAGTMTIFGGLASDPTFGSAFVFSALPVIIFFAALVSILYHLGIMQFVIRWVGGAIETVIGVSKVEALCAAANIFVGQSESPLVIRPYLASLTPPQLFAVMTVGMSGVAGTILLAYATFLGQGALPYLLAASFMSAPGGLLMAKIIMPDVSLTPVGELPLGDDPEEAVLHVAEQALEEERAANLIMAAANGAQTGVRIAVAVGAMVLAFVGLVALANGMLGGIGGWFGYPDLSFQGILGYVFAPVMYLLDIPWNEARIAGQLFGQKIVLNEFVAFIDLGKMKDLSPHTTAVVTFALCGFANFSSIAIQMASTGSLAPNQRPMIAKLGLRALAAGSLANLMSAALAGLLLG
ncbi:MAG: NupC/NupG family nucleoside CNT transporter [Sphingomonas sp.]|uniref:NupC/NupG family nucleoside CNT transporter n=1 Tax=unclassified Sphingomonas TaxID=196159 RepID=UPI00053D7CFE|nr:MULTISPECIES: nucleoside transporter C-terminal domain-containing protein [unclassified Sphingomonas]MDR6848009.1 CNT family concentrative nucleoside transporter [Sphingomonas sp. BE137]MDR7258311.1 CNT family concentrative nucleoside transporter [Sphingomonas sp. BE270]